MHFTKPHLPINIPVLYSIKRASSKEAPSYDNTTFWSMCCTAFFDFLWVGKFIIPAGGSYDPSCHLSLRDVTVDNRANPRLLQLLLRQSKTDRFKQGVKVYMGATDRTVCPIQAVLSYLKQRSTKPGPLFITGKGKGCMFSSSLKSILHKLKLNQHDYNTNSF